MTDYEKFDFMSTIGKAKIDVNYDVDNESTIGEDKKTKATVLGGRVINADEKTILNDPDNYFQSLSFMNGNTLDSEFSKKSRMRRLQIQMIESPIKYLKHKNDISESFIKSAKVFRGILFRNLVSKDLEVSKSREIAENVAKKLYELLEHVLDKELFPSEFDRQIVNSRKETLSKRFNKPVDSAFKKGMEEVKDTT
jgi:hypothetical protein